MYSRWMDDEEIYNFLQKMRSPNWIKNWLRERKVGDVAQFKIVFYLYTCFIIGHSI
jgi:hypothetical protein